MRREHMPRPKTFSGACHIKYTCWMESLANRLIVPRVPRPHSGRHARGSLRLPAPPLTLFGVQAAGVGPMPQLARASCPRARRRQRRQRRSARGLRVWVRTGCGERVGVMVGVGRCMDCVRVVSGGWRRSRRLTISTARGAYASVRRIAAGRRVARRGLAARARS